MAVNLHEPDDLRPVAGARWAVADAAIKAPGKPDLALLRLDAISLLQYRSGFMNLVYRSANKRKCQRIIRKVNQA